MKRLFLSMVAVLTAFILQAQETFTTSGVQLTDATGQPFIIVGMNNPHAWFGERAYQALDDIASTNANTVRIVWNTRGRADDLERIISRCIDLKMVPMVELHDVTGNSSGQRLLDMVGYYSRDDVKTVLMRHQRYLLINIANEWGEHHVTTQHWQDSYQAAVAEMRKAGFKTTLVIDAPGWGQNIQPILEGGRQLIEKDPLHNILFSVHMYGSWNNAQDIIDKLTAAKEQNLPLIVGEFGYNYENGNNNLKCKADHRTIMKTCKLLGYGFMPWSWTGNNKENAWLDIVDHRDWKTPTQWGNEVIDGENGIRQTAVTANVFDKKYENKRVVLVNERETNYFPAIDRYLADSIGSKYAKGEHCVPIHSIVRVDERNAEDILVWGDFWVFNYNQVGDTLKCVSGGSHPGLLHIRQTEKGFEVTAFDQVEDGSRYLPTAKKIFGDKYDAFQAINSDEKNRERLRADVLATYAKKNGLAVTLYQDYGWPAKKLGD